MDKREKAKEKYGDLMKKWEEEQNFLISKIDQTDKFDLKNIQYVGGVDISFGKDENAVSALVVLDMKNNMKVVYEDYGEIKMHLPYIPTFLAFREIPGILKLIEKMQKNAPEFTPEVIMVDGNGILHPRKCGIATHLGIVCGIPTIGVSKKFLVVDGWTRVDIDNLKKNVFKKEGDMKEVIGKTDGFCYGMVYRGKSIQPIYISVGSGVSLKTAVELVAKTCLYKIPQPIREADLRSRDYIRKQKKKEQKKN